MKRLWILCVVGVTASACESGTGELSDVGIAVCQAENGPFTADVDHPYLPFVIGSVHVLEGLEGGTVMYSLEIEVLDQTAEVGGVTARIVEERSSDGTQHSFYAQAPDGTVCAFGEDEDADGEPEWEAGVNSHLAGIIMPATPKVGMIFETFHGPVLIERGEITHVGVPTETPAGTFKDTLTVLEDGPSIKKCARDIGVIYDDGIELISY